MARPFYPRRPQIGGIAKQIEWFWEQTKEVESGCIEWQRSLDTLGYGHIQWDGKSQSTHRCAWRFKKGDIPIGLAVLHRCDNRKCVNVDHLFLGTHTDNMRDMNKKGRRIVPRGEDNWQASLTWDQADEVRRLQKEGARGKDLALLFNVSVHVISSIVTGKTYNKRPESLTVRQNYESSFKSRST